MHTAPFARLRALAGARCGAKRLCPSDPRSGSRDRSAGRRAPAGVGAGPQGRRRAARARPHVPRHVPDRRQRRRRAAGRAAARTASSCSAPSAARRRRPAEARALRRSRPLREGVPRTTQALPQFGRLCAAIRPRAWAVERGETSRSARRGSRSEPRSGRTSRSRRHAPDRTRRSRRGARCTPPGRDRRTGRSVRGSAPRRLARQAGALRRNARVLDDSVSPVRATWCHVRSSATRCRR